MKFRNKYNEIASVYDEIIPQKIKYLEIFNIFETLNENNTFSNHNTFIYSDNQSTSTS